MKKKQKSMKPFQKQVKCAFCGKRTAIKQTINETDKGLGYVCLPCDASLKQHYLALFQEKRKGESARELQGATRHVDHLLRSPVKQCVSEKGELCQ